MRADWIEMAGGPAAPRTATCAARPHAAAGGSFSLVPAQQPIIGYCPLSRK